jgi:hypothetical protein
MSGPQYPEKWELFRDTINSCLRDGYAPPERRSHKGSAIAEATRRLKEDGVLDRSLANPLLWWMKRQKTRAKFGQEHFLPDWSLFQDQAIEKTPKAEHPKTDDAVQRRIAHEEGFWRKKSKELAKTLAETEHVLREVSGLMRREADPPNWLFQTGEGQRHKAAGLLHLSDLHAGEVVRSEEIGGLNEYNPDVFQRRIRRAFSATMEILPRWTSDCQPAGVVVAINGDLVSGDIHDELRRSNALTAHEQVYLVTDELTAGLAQLADAFGHVFAVFTPGNHGRTTEKTHAKRTSALSYDTLIGEQVRRHFMPDRRVTVWIAPGADAVYPVLGWTVFQSHGDALGTGGGKGFAGPVLPIVRGAKSVEWQAARVRRSYDILLTGHYHVSANPGGGVLANGSVVGYNEYANRIRAGVEPPQQWLALIHSRWGLRERCEIRLEDPVPPRLPRIRVPASMAKHAEPPDHDPAAAR